MNDDEINNMMSSASKHTKQQQEESPSSEHLFRKNMSENMQELQENLASIFDKKDRGFAESLCEFYQNKGWLSNKQLYWACKYWVESKSGSRSGIEKLAPKRAPIDNIIPPRVQVDGRLLIRYFDAAAKKLQRPKIGYKILPKPISGCEQFIFYRTGEQSVSPASVGVSNGLQYPNNRILALMYRDGRTIFYPWTFDKPELQQLIKKVAEDPLHHFSENGKATKTCCYCGKILTHPSSLFYGYGPTCAGHYGLPWGDMPPEHQQLSIGLEGNND